MKIKINPFFFVTAFFCCVFGNPLYFFLIYVTLVIHELVHLFFLYKEKVGIRSIQLEPFGICIKTDVVGKVSPWVYISAPLFNILLSVFFYLISKKYNNSVYLLLSSANLITGTFNLIPSLPFDGGRAIMLFIKKKNSFVFFSLTAGIIILAFGIYLFWKTSFNFSLIMTGLFIIANSFSEREQLFCNTALKTKEKVTGTLNETAITKMITVPFDYNAHAVLKSLHEDSFYLINIIKDGVILKTISETQLLDGIINGKIKIYI